VIESQPSEQQGVHVATLEVRGVSKSYGEQAVVGNFTASVARGALPRAATAGSMANAP